MSSKGKTKVRIGFIIDSEVRAAQIAVRDTARILPSHQVDLALREYYKARYPELLETHGIQL